MQLAIETTMLTAPGSCSGAILCLLHRAAAGEAPALAGAAAAGARALALNVDMQLHAVKQCSPLEGKLRHRLLQQACLNHMLNLFSLSPQGWCVFSPSVKCQGHRPGPIFC